VPDSDRYIRGLGKAAEQHPAGLEEQPGASVADVARAVASTRQSASELVAGMERARLAEPHGPGGPRLTTGLTPVAHPITRNATDSRPSSRGRGVVAVDA